MHKQVSGRTVNFGPNFPDQSLLRNTPLPNSETSDLGWPKFTPEYPPPNSENFRFGMTKVYSRIPPQKLKFRQILALCDFSVSESPPPRKLKFRQTLALCDFSVSEYPPPQKLKFRQILALCDFSVSEYPPPPPENWNLGRSWHFVTFQFQNTPLPPENWNLGRSWHFVTFQFHNTPPPWKFKFRQIFPMGNYVWQVTTCGDFIQPG